MLTSPGGGGTNCSGFDATTSEGYNFADDTSCSFGSIGDVQRSGADPALGGLASNGGPTLTLLPEVGSPLIDAIPTSACQAGTAAGITTDQRGEARPQGVGCDIGAVEVVPALVATPRFTG